MIELFEKRMRKEKNIQTYFSHVFYNGKKNRSEIFSIEKKRNILFYYFQIYLKCNGYLLNTVLIIVSIHSAQYEGAGSVALILFNKKNKFVTLQKMEIFLPYSRKDL